MVSETHLIVTGARMEGRGAPLLPHRELRSFPESLGPATTSYKATNPGVSEDGFDLLGPATVAQG